MLGKKLALSRNGLIFCLLHGLGTDADKKSPLLGHTFM